MLDYPKAFEWQQLWCTYGIMTFATHTSLVEVEWCCSQCAGVKSGHALRELVGICTGQIVGQV